MDAAADPLVEEIDCLKGAQIGWSDICRNLFGYWVDMDPGPTMILLPDQKSAEDFKVERIDPLIKNTLALQRHLTSRAWDDTKHRIRFDTMSAYFVWAGSKSGTKSRPIRRLICEEPDEYPPFSSTGGDPLSKAEKRLTTYRDKGRSKILLGGTPTTRTGNICKRWDTCSVRFHFWVPCPHCGTYQILQWKQVKWPPAVDGEGRARHAERLKLVGVAHYECEKKECGKRIDDHHKPEMLRRGVWANEDQVVGDGGRVLGPDAVAKRIGFKISGLYSPWVMFGQLAAEWILAQDDRQALMDFINQRLAEPFETISSETNVTVIEEKSKGAPPAMIVPSWAKRLIATADTQGKDEASGYFYYVIRAWGMAWRSQLVDAGIVSTKEELYHRCLGRTIQVDGHGQVAPQYLFPDSGGPRWQEIYSFALTDPGHIKPTKGSNRRLQWMIDKKLQRDHGIILWLVDTQQSKDQLHLLIHNEDRTLWTLNDKLPSDYIRQMMSEHKVLDQNGNEVWQEKPGKPANHFWDCEQLQVAAAWSEGCGMSDPPADLIARQQQPAQRIVSSMEPPDNWMNR